MTQEPGAEDVSWQQLRPQVIKMALELGPLVVFFVANAYGALLIRLIPLFAGLDDPLYPATLFFMIAMVISLLLSWLLLHRIAVMPLVTGAVVLVFGALTFYFRDTTFIKMKPTVVNLLFGGTLLGGLLFGQSLLRYVFGDVYKLKPRGWVVLTVRWGLFFFVLAILNEVVWRMFDTNTWVAFKVWGIMPLTIVFSLLQLPVLKEYAPDAPGPDLPAE